MDISVVIPVFNEEENISLLHTELRDTLGNAGKTYEIVFVNDGSTDATSDEILKARGTDPGVKMVELNRNFGQTPAVMAGVDLASGEVIVIMDGDLQNDPRDIPSLIEKLEEGYDLVSGWRKKRKDAFLLRVIPSKLANLLISSVLKVPLHDYGCTLKAYRKNTIKGLNLYGEMHRFIPAIAGWQGARITEMEVNHRSRKHGKSKYGISRITRVLLDLLLVAFLSEYSTKPIRFFGGIGIISNLLSLATLLLVIYMKIARGTDMTGNPLLILCVLFFLVGIQFISMGFLGEINIRTYYESQGKKTYHIKETVQ